MASRPDGYAKPAIKGCLFIKICQWQRNILVAKTFKKLNDERSVCEYVKYNFNVLLCILWKSIRTIRDGCFEMGANLCS